MQVSAKYATADPYTVRWRRHHKHKATRYQPFLFFGPLVTNIQTTIEILIPEQRLRMMLNVVSSIEIFTSTPVMSIHIDHSPFTGLL